MDSSGLRKTALAASSRLRTTGDRTGPAAKKLYVPPSLQSHGDLRSFTLGGSPGIGDSGATFSEDPLF